jgi:hypothetical protein
MYFIKFILNKIDLYVNYYTNYLKMRDFILFDELEI